MIRAKLVLALGLTLLCVGCATPEDVLKVDRRLVGLAGEVAALKTELAAVKGEAAAAVKSSKQAAGLAADIDAVKAYFKQVSDKVRSMRDDIVRLLDEQNVRIDEGRKAYLKVLQHQKQVLEATQAELDKAMKVLDPTAVKVEGNVTDAPPRPKIE